MKLGRYEVVRELGKGAMGIVYLAKDPLIGRLVALKTIRPVAYAEDDETKEFQQRFVREAQAAGILNHPAIVTVFDIGQDDATGMSFIAMEYVEGQNLKEILAQGRTLTFDQIGELIAQVADALDFAHSKGIVHRDVKPANIIVLEGNRAKIMDFGIAKIASGGNLTSTGQFLGTPNYMAPEQIKGTPVDGRTDIFSLGICLYECLTRRKPFGGDSLTSISYKIVHESFPTLAEINPQIPDGYEEIAARSLAKDPARRYQRGKELALALRAVVRGEKPMTPEPVMAEETVITRDRDRLPTLEMPFPDAIEDPGLNTRPSTAGGLTPAPAQAAAGGGSVAASAAARPVVRRVPVRDRMRNTMTNVRALPLWRQPVPLTMFIILLILAVAALVVPIVSIRKQTPAVPAVDRQAETKANRERQLRQEANLLLQQGNVRGAYEKYQELRKVAPDSPAVAVMVQKLGAITQRAEIDRQQKANAKTRLDQGIALYNQKKFAEAVPVLQEAFSLDPNDEQAANYLKRAQLEQQNAEQARLAAKKPKAAVATTTSRAGTPSATATAVPVAGNAAPARLTLVFNSPFSDGYIMVKAGGDTVAHENVFEERGRSIFRRTVPRVVNITKELPAKNADLQIWVVVPSKNITEYHVIRHNFLPGSSQRLQVSYNEQNRSFEYQLN